MKKFFGVFKDILDIVYNKKSSLVVLCTIGAVIVGILNVGLTWVNSNIINMGLEVANGTLEFTGYAPYLIILLVCMVLPPILNTMQVTYIQPMSEMIFRDSYKGEMLKKLKKLKYSHFENEESIEIIDKAYTRAEEGALHLFPKYYYNFIVYGIGSLGILYMFCSVSYLFLLTILVPFFIEVILSYKNQFNIYEEMDSYWNDEYKYKILGDMIKSKDSIKENSLFNSSDYLINTYKDRLHKRNKVYEKFYFLNFRKFFFSSNLTKVAQIFNALLLLYFYNVGVINIGILSALTLAVFAYLWDYLDGALGALKNTSYHMKAFDYYYQYLELDEETVGTITEVPSNVKIEFRNVNFAYPNTDKKILDEVSFIINESEKVSLVGANGEGKSTIIKLLLGLFEPDSGDVLINDKRVFCYSREVRESLFGVVFQDFNKYSLTLAENIRVGNINNTNNNELEDVINTSKLNRVVKNLPSGKDTLLGREFEGATDLSGGEWQRIAIACALVGNKPILILDEPTSQLDPMAESALYSEFLKIAENKTTLFVTHRLGSTTVTDKIIVLQNGKIVENGTSKELLELGNVYYNMWQSQKKWYEQDTEVTNV